MTGEEDSEVVLNNNSSCTQISSQQKSQKRKDDTGSNTSNGSSLSSQSDESRQIGGGVQGRAAELVSEVSSVSGEPLTSLGHPSKNSVFSENDADIISTTALSNSPSVDSNSEVFISGASTSTSAHCGNGESTSLLGGGPHHGLEISGTPTGHSQLSDAQAHDDPDHVVLPESELASASLEQMVQVYHQLQSYIHKLKGENQDLKDTEEKLRLQQNEASRRENTLAMRLATKELEMHEYATQISELKSSMIPTSNTLKNSLLDPAVNFVIQRMKKELTETKKKLEDTQNDLNAWKFTADSNTGKRLMAKCRMLYQENEDLGKMITTGRLAKLESDLALQKSLLEEMKRGQSEMDDLVQELDEDVEGMQSTIFFLQQQLREKITCNTANSSSSQSSELLVNISELCAQCRAAQEKKQKLNQTSSSHANSSSDDKVVKMEVDNSIDEENSRTLDSSVSSDNERTFLNGESELYSPDREQMEQAKLLDKRTRVTRLSLVSKQPSQVNLNAESTSPSSDSNNLGLTVHTTQCNVLDGNGTGNNSNNTKRKATTPSSSLLATDGNDKASDEELGESDNMVKPTLTKRTKLNSGNRSVNNVGQLQTSIEEARTAGQTLLPTSSRNRNGAVEHS
ncbi:unnamed protein product [Orchesella dallaii]|uniref:Pre-mRNA-splicing regulator female-lethal(2)D n=1 Tax=Orchesella dallaii TaxID=48710 RepID=A0ABP1R5C4_9HEXA